MSKRAVVRLAFLFVAMFCLSDSIAAQNNVGLFVWSHDPSADLLFQRGNFRHFVLSESAPEDVEVRIEPGVDALFGQLRFGDEDSKRITLLFDSSDKEVQLYADLNRDRVLELSELIAAKADATQKNRWIVGLTAAISNTRTSQAERAVEIRLVDGFMLAASLGNFSGKVSLDGQSFQARRIDGNVDGLLTSKSDRLWIDLNSDGTWDPLTEQFTNSPVVLIGEKRFKLSTTPAGDQLEFDEITGIGSIELKLKNRSLVRKIESIEVTLTEQSGMYFSISAFKKSLEAPVGKYRLHSIVCTVKGEKQDPPITFSFYNHEPKDEWMTLDADQQLTVDPFGEMKLTLEPVDASQIPNQRGSILVQPRLVTGTGLLITSCHRGNDPNAHVLAKTRFEVPGEWNDTANSGFA